MNEWKYRKNIKHAFVGQTALPPFALVFPQVQAPLLQEGLEQPKGGFWEATC